MLDCLIIGSGPAGMTAAIYCIRNNMKVMIVESSAPGGQMINTSTIENYPGFSKIDGASLAYSMYEQVTNLGVEYIFGTAKKIKKENNLFITTVDNQEYQSKTIIVATGTSKRKLGIPSENKFIGKGISWCAICDGSLYKNKPVAVVGGGNSSIEEAIYLSSIASVVYIIHRRDEFRCDESLINKARNIGNIQIITNTIVEEFQGDNVLETLKLKNIKNNEIFEINVNGCFEFVGQIPSSDLLKDFNVLDDQGYIIVDNNYATSEKGLFACGDVVEKQVRQIATAINDGAIAALSASKECK